MERGILAATCYCVGSRGDGTIGHSSGIRNSINRSGAADRDRSGVQCSRRLTRRAPIQCVADGRPRHRRTDGHRLGGAVCPSSWAERRRAHPTWRIEKQSRYNGVQRSSAGEADGHVTAEIPNQVLAVSEAGNAAAIECCTGSGIQDGDSSGFRCQVVDHPARKQLVRRRCPPSSLARCNCFGSLREN
jgi:hypothetical protein